MNVDSLEKLADDDLRAMIARADSLLKQHDTERKEKALSEARTLLASVGLSLKDLTLKATKAKGSNGEKTGSYHAGHRYQHPTNKALVWAGKGKKPTWLTALESDGKSAIEIANGKVSGLED